MHVTVGYLPIFPFALPHQILHHIPLRLLNPNQTPSPYLDLQGHLYYPKSLHILHIPRVTRPLDPLLTHYPHYPQTHLNPLWFTSTKSLQLLQRWRNSRYMRQLRPFILPQHPPWKHSILNSSYATSLQDLFPLPELYLVSVFIFRALYVSMEYWK